MATFSCAFCKPYLSLLYGSLSALCYAVCSVIVKKTAYISPSQMSMVSNAGTLAFSVPLVVYWDGRKSSSKDSPLLTLAASFCSSTGMFVRYYAYRLIPLSESAVISCTTPFVVALMARLYLKETLGMAQGSAAVVATAGMLLSVRLPELLAIRSDLRLDWNYIAGVVSAIVAVILLAIGIVLTRRLNSFSMRLLVTAAVGVVENALALFLLERYVQSLCGMDAFLMVVLGFFTYLGLLFIILSVEAGKAAVASLVKSSMDVVFAMLLQLLFFGDVPDTYNSGGTVLVLLAIAIIGARQWLSSMPEKASLRRKLKFLLM